MFRMYDCDGNGLISKDEFIRMLRWVIWDREESRPGQGHPEGHGRDLPSPRKPETVLTRRDLGDGQPKSLHGVVSGVL